MSEAPLPSWQTPPQVGQSDLERILRNYERRLNALGTTKEAFGITGSITADGASRVTIAHGLGRIPLFATASVTTPGYIVGYSGGTATTAVWWISDSASASVAGSVFTLTWLVK